MNKKSSFLLIKAHMHACTHTYIHAHTQRKKKMKKDLVCKTSKTFSGCSTARRAAKQVFLLLMELLVQLLKLYFLKNVKYVFPDPMNSFLVICAIGTTT